MNRVFSVGAIVFALASPLLAESGFQVQRVGSSNELPTYAGSFDEKKNAPVRRVNWQLPNGTVQVINSEQAAALDVEPLGQFATLDTDRREALAKFIDKTVVPFLRLLRKPKGAISAGAAVSREAEKLFPGSDVGATFEELAEASVDPDNNEAQIRGCVSRLNAAFHPLGIHFTFGRFAEFDGGTVELTVCAVAQRLLVQIKDRTMPVYVLAPFDTAFHVLALGMMEPYPPRIFIFSDMVELQVQDINVFLRSEKDYPFEDPGVPVASVPNSVQTKINEIVRHSLRRAVGTDHHAVERWLVNSIARHEGQHLYIDNLMKAAAESGKIEWEDFNRFHERQAYLFELETSDSQFTPFVLLASFAISAALSDPYSRVGCGAALRGLQKQLPALKFWDGDFNRPLADGLIPLFDLPPEDVRRAASRARSDVEKFLTSEDDPSEATTEGR